LIQWKSCERTATVRKIEIGIRQFRYFFNARYPPPIRIAIAAVSPSDPPVAPMNVSSMSVGMPSNFICPSGVAPVTLTVNCKPEYDEDDMKVIVDPDGRLREVGKKIPLEEVTGESIGMLLFRDSGVPDFRATLERAVRSPDSLKRWYLSVVNELAQRMVVRTTAITGLWWQEIDEPADLDAARAGLRGLRYGDNEPKEPIPPVLRPDSP